MNRGVARRAVFETTADRRLFLSKVARMVRRGWLEVHSYSILTTHFHLLVRSPVGRVSEAMHWIESGYARRFNRGRGRDGPLFRGRFVAKAVDELQYRRTLITYIDQNAVKAGLVEHPEQHVYGSAYWFLAGFAHGHARPKWLTRTWIVHDLRDLTGRGMGLADAYARAFSRRDHVDLEFLVENGFRPDLIDLIGNSPDRVADWLIENARNADGEAPERPIIGPVAIERAIRQAEVKHGPWFVFMGRRGRPALPILHAGLLRNGAAMSFESIGQRLVISATTARKWVATHHVLVDDDPDYRERATDVTLCALCQKCGSVPGTDAR